MNDFRSLLARAVTPRFLHPLLGLHTTVHESARWMNRWERGRFFSKGNRGLVFSPARRMSEKESFKNLSLVAPTGSGKTTRYVIPNLLELSGSAVVTDPSGEIYRATSGWLSVRGFDVKVIQPADAGRSLRFNPLSALRRPQELRELARTLAEYGNAGEGGGDAGSGGDGAFWTHGAAEILYLGLRALMAAEAPQYRNLGNLRWLLNHYGHAGEGVAGFFARHLGTMERADFTGFISQDRKVAASMVSTARAGLSLWNDADLCLLTGEDGIGLAELRRKPTVIYLIVPENRIRYFSLILNLFYSSCFAHCLESWDREEGGRSGVGGGGNGGGLLPVYFFLDEFGNLGRIANFQGIVTTLRKRNCSVSLILQEPSQLETVYGRTAAETILSGGCASKLYFSGTDRKTAEDVERRLGAETVSDTNFEGSDENARKLGKPLLRAEEIRRMPANRGILISGRERPAYLKLPAYYEVAAWRKRTEITPPPFPGEAARRGTGDAGDRGNGTEGETGEAFPLLPLR